MSGADFLSPAAENKPEHLGINLLEQGTQESSSEGNSPCQVIRLWASVFPLPARSRAIAALCAVCSQHKPAAGRKLLPVCTGRVQTAAAARHAQPQSIFGASRQPNIRWRRVRIFFFLQKPENFSTFVMLQSGRGQGHWGNLLFILEVCIRFPTAERHAV